MKKGQKIHNRQIDIASYKGEVDSIIVEGILHDERFLEAYYPTGEVLSPGTVHHLIVRLEIKGPKLIIEDVEVEMPTIPHEDCVEMLECLFIAEENIKGILKQRHLILIQVGNGSFFLQGHIGQDVLDDLVYIGGVGHAFSAGGLNFCFSEIYLHPLNPTSTPSNC